MLVSSSLVCRSIALPILVGALSCAQAPELSQSSGAIVGGTATTGYPAVAQLSVKAMGADGASYSGCSSTLISPRVLLTAAHCIDFEDSTTEEITAYFGTRSNGSDPGFIQSIPAVDWIFADPWNLSGNDIAMVLLEYDSDVDPVLYNTQPLSSSAIGAPLHVIGWGNTAVDIGSGVKRHMTTPITGFQSNLVLNYGDSSGNTCQGDSGGPGFATFDDGLERIVGITSFGRGECLGESGSTRVGQYNNFISSWVTAKDVPIPPELSIVRPSDGEEVGAGFQVEIEASDNTRVERLEIYIDGILEADLPVNIPPYIIRSPTLPDGPVVVEARAYDNRGDMTSKSVTVTVDSTCDGPQDCGATFFCSDEGMCLPLDYGLGEACSNADECSSGLCATVKEETLCTSECTPGDSGSCPSGFACLKATDELGYCWADSGDSGGCSTSGTSGLAGSLLLLLGLFTTGAWRRRRQTSDA